MTFDRVVGLSLLILGVLLGLTGAYAASSATLLLAGFMFWLLHTEVP